MSGLPATTAPFAARLGMLARLGWTGAVHLTGAADGSIYLRGGTVIYASSSRSPRPAGGPDGSLAWALALEEATVDAAAEVLCDHGRQAPRLREGESPGAVDVTSLPVAELLTEVGRRLEILERLSALGTADTVVVRNPGFGLHRVRVSALQWALLIRVGERSTPRSLAFELGRSVFGTTMEVYRLVALELLAPVSAPGRPVAGPAPERRRASVSFLGAAAPQPPQQRE